MRFELKTDRFYLGRHYSEALENFGAVPIHLSLIAKKEYIEQALDGIDGILLPGSNTDVDPERFGEEPHANFGRNIPLKDETDLLILQEAEKRKLPVLAICFGMQVLNVSRGGSLIQDINSQIVGSFKHQQGEPSERNSHFIEILEDTTLLRLITRRDIKVNSHHHQSVKEVGENLCINAKAKDGVIEGIEDTREDRFVLGLQWHPELNWETDENSQIIFKSFVEKCREGKAK